MYLRVEVYNQLVYNFPKPARAPNSQKINIMPIKTPVRHDRLLLAACFSEETALTVSCFDSFLWLLTDRGSFDTNCFDCFDTFGQWAPYILQVCICRLG